MNVDLEYAIEQLKKAKTYRSYVAKDDCIQRALDALERLQEEIANRPLQIASNQ